MTTVANEIAIQIAKLVVRSNIECYNNICNDEDIKKSASDFKQYGIDVETVTSIIQHNVGDILTEVKRLQSQVAEVLYD